MSAECRGEICKFRMRKVSKMLQISKISFILFLLGVIFSIAP